MTNQLIPTCLRWCSIVGLLAASAVACVRGPLTGRPEPGDGGAGTAGVAGVAGTAGVAGVAGTAGVAGVAGTSGSGGDTGGGNGGGGGQGGSAIGGAGAGGSGTSGAGGSAAGGRGGAGTGGGGAAQKCRTDTVFDPPVLLDGVNVPVDNTSDAAQLSPDELTVYFGSNRTGPDPAGWNLWTATRTALGQPFTGLTTLSQVNSSLDEDGASVTADGLTLYYTAGVPNTGPWRIYRSTRSSTAVAFPPAAVAPDVNISGTLNGQIYVMPDGSALYYIATTDGNGQEIWRAQAAAGGRFNSPVHLSELGSSALEAEPVVTNDELTIYFGSTRGGGAGNIDIWMASRTSTTQPFGAPRNVAELNTGLNDVPSWISPDQCRLYMWRTAIYVASRRP